MVHKWLKFLKQMEIAIVMIVGNVEDERTFSIVNFMKSTFLNHLATHLDLVVQMYVQKFYRLETFLFYITIKNGERRSCSMEKNRWLEIWH